jgi:ketosteroid isomerase-like protein
MMSVEENKQVISEAFRYLSNGDMQKLVDSFTDDFKSWVNGSSRLSGILDRSYVADFYLHHFGELFPKGLTLYIDHMIGEGDYVAVEGRSHADIAGKNMENYENTYHWSFKLRDGKIERWREYLDTALLDKVDW